MIDLKSFLVKYDRKPFAWGSNDCNTFILDYANNLAAHDGTRPTLDYIDEPSAIEFARKHDLIFCLGKYHGAIFIHEPIDGDIHLIKLPEGYYSAGLVYAGKRWSIMRGSSLIPIPLVGMPADSVIMRIPLCHR